VRLRDDLVRAELVPPEPREQRQQRMCIAGQEQKPAATE
jgi:hypothetical protein